MNKFDKAVDFYLRGFNGQYIKRRTGISVQSLLKQLRAKGVVYTKSDIVAHQIAYIRSHFSTDDVIAAYHSISEKYADLHKFQRGRHIECLGCGFGDYPKVFRELLGADVYKKLSNECWHAKQVRTMQQKYGTDNAFRKDSFGSFVSEEAVADGRHRRTETMLARYGVEHPNQNDAIAAKMQDSLKKTNMQRYGVENPMSVPEIAQKSANTRQAVMTERYGAPNSVQVESIRLKIFDRRRKNGTLNTSKPEDMLYQLLIDRFGEDDVFRNAIVDDRYPWHVDFYIRSLDLFIELNGDKCHNNHWYDASCVSDRQTLQAWCENAQRLEEQTGKTSRYRKYIRTWSETDVAKRNAAQCHRLHYLVFWDGSNKKGIPQLQDAHAWFADGCPMPETWRKENTY